MGYAITVVVVVHDMVRELPRTLATLAPEYQRGIDSSAYEVIVVDNGSQVPVDATMLERVGVPVRSIRIDDAPPSPARAANTGIEIAEGALVGLIVDGARMASPGLLAGARLGARVADRPVVTTAGFHLGHQRQMEAAEQGYDQSQEDELLAGTDWERNGYDLFTISTFAGSSGRGWFGPLGESSALFMPRDLWLELGGLDEAFALPGGGLVNHDLYHRACASDGTSLVMVLGEGTFHQYHGGAATSRRYSWDEMDADYERIRGSRYRPPLRAPVYVGGIPPQALGHLEHSIERAKAARDRRERG